MDEEEIRLEAEARDGEVDGGADGGSRDGGLVGGPALLGHCEMRG